MLLTRRRSATCRSCVQIRDLKTGLGSSAVSPRELLCRHSNRIGIRLPADLEASPNRVRRAVVLSPSFLSTSFIGSLEPPRFEADSSCAYTNDNSHIYTYSGYDIGPR